MKNSKTHTVLFYICFGVILSLMLIYQMPGENSGGVLIFLTLFLGLICFFSNANHPSNIMGLAILLATCIGIATLKGSIDGSGEEGLAKSFIYANLWFFVFNIGAYFNCRRVNIVHISVIISLYTILSCFFESMFILNDYSQITGYYEITTVYYLLLVVPFLLCVPNKSTRTILLFASAFFCIMSFKRTIILALLIVAALWFIKYSKSLKKRWLYFLFFIIVAICVLTKSASQDVGNVLDIWAYRFGTNDPGEGQLGERGRIYKDVLNMLINSTPTEFLFGHGYNSAMYFTKSGFSAHNDFLELWYDFGFISLVVYLMLLYRLVKNYIILERCKIKEINEVPIFSILVSIVLTVFCGFFSHLITYATHFMLIALFWGWVSPCFNYSNENRYVSDEKNRNSDISQCI